MSNQLKEYLDFTLNDTRNLELEVRFGTIGKKINRLQFDNVIEYLKSKNFGYTSNPQESLRIQSEFLDPNIGRNIISNIRCEINGSSLIKEYCMNESVQTEDLKVRSGIVFNQKRFVKKQDGKQLRPISVNDYNFRISLNEEKIVSSQIGILKQILNEWNDKKKVYRMIQRYTFIHHEYPYLKIDMSVVRSSKKNKKNNLIPSYSIKESNVFLNPPEYEIEIEFMKSSIWRKQELYSMNTEDKTNYIVDSIKKLIKYILSGLQESNFPIPISTIHLIQTEYVELIKGYSKKENEDEPIKTFLRPNTFIGPSSISLELKHIQKLEGVDETKQSQENIYYNIRKNYCVTDKADGKRKLMYISKSGDIYLIDTNMNVQYTGMKTKQKTHMNSLIDGEHIIHDKKNNHLHLYACFDIYFIQGEDQRSKMFYTNNEDELSSEYRLYQLQEFIGSLKMEQIAKSETPFKTMVKYFEISKTKNDIFKCCNNIMSKIDEGMYEYETDGLIFTPLYLGVGCKNKEDKPKNKKSTWLYSFKWKPPQYNTIDFLATTQKNDSGQDIVKSIFQEGTGLSSSSNTIQNYKTLILRVGFDERNHGYINPCVDVIEDKMPNIQSLDNNDNYRPVPFYPSNPTDNKAYLCNVLLENEGSSGGIMMTEDRTQYFGDNTIIECKYVSHNKEGWRWIPIRVREDKTAEYRAGLKNYGNAYHVAQSVWSSIHNPITKQMISTGLKIPEVLADDDVYYNRTRDSQTQALRDFHNLYVKKKLIQGVSRPGNILVDLAVGKGGDFPKWIKSKLKFVLGIDISKDNIENRLDGACARYLNYKKSEQKIPDCLFLNGDSGKHILSGDACFNEKGKQIVQAVFGKGPKDKQKLGGGVYKQYSIAKDGFDIVSCQFAIHYFFKDPKTLHNFLRNVCEMCKLGGYFIGTCYDGQKIFNILRNKKQNESIVEMKNEAKVWEITKIYDSDVFEHNVESVGLEIDVYQDTINKVFREYLVNFEYLKILMENYGFEVVVSNEAKKMKLPNGSDTFDSLFYRMKREIATEKKIAKYSKTYTNIGTALQLENDPIQEKISFLNRYFIFKKVRQVNCESIYKNIDTKIEKEKEEILDVKIQKEVLQEQKDDKKEKRKDKKRKKKLDLSKVSFEE